LASRLTPQGFIFKEWHSIIIAIKILVLLYTKFIFYIGKFQNEIKNWWRWSWEWFENNHH